MKLKLSEIKANPFKKQIDGGKTKEEENQLMNTVLKQNIIATAKIAQELTLE